MKNFTKSKRTRQNPGIFSPHASIVRAAIILTGLGFAPNTHKEPTKSFSGGWRMRLALARALFCQPDLLLCDEPTNHLDMPAVVWLSDYLSSWRGTLLVVSHDREFLDNIATDILHMHNERIDHYRGNFSEFLRSRQERRTNQQKEFDAQMQYRNHLQAFIDRWRYNAKRAPQAQSKLKLLEKLPALNPVEEDGLEPSIHDLFRWPDPVEKLSPPILQGDDVSFCFDDPATPPNLCKIILDRVSFSISHDSRIAIVGANGSGKVLASFSFTLFPRQPFSSSLLENWCPASAVSSIDIRV